MKYTENCVYAVILPAGIKIGFTSRLGDRLSAFQKEYCAPCYPIALIVGIDRDSAILIEKNLHGLFADKRTAPETFNISAQEVSAAFDEVFL